jgi:hypothetical protein
MLEEAAEVVVVASIATMITPTTANLTIAAQHRACHLPRLNKQQMAVPNLVKLTHMQFVSHFADSTHLPRAD